MKKIVFLVALFFANFTFAKYIDVTRGGLDKIVYSSHEYRVADTHVKHDIRNFFALPYEGQEGIIWAYQQGSKQDLGLTLAAIAWQESHGGLIPLNLFDKPWGSCGMFHNYLKTVVHQKRLDGEPFVITKYNLNKLCIELIENPDYSLSEAVKVIMVYKRKYHDNWMKIWAAYNGGSRPNYKYAKSIYWKVKAFKIIYHYYVVNNGLGDNKDGE